MTFEHSLQLYEEDTSSNTFNIYTCLNPGNLSHRVGPPCYDKSDCRLRFSTKQYLLVYTPSPNYLAPHDLPNSYFCDSSPLHLWGTSSGSFLQTIEEEQEPHPMPTRPLPSIPLGITPSSSPQSSCTSILEATQTPSSTGNRELDFLIWGLEHILDTCWLT